MNPHFSEEKAARDALVSLPRSGTRPLIFSGHLIASGSAKGGPEDKHVVRWHEIRLYRGASGIYVLAINFRTTCRHEQPWDDAFVCEDAEHVVETLEDYDPVSYVLGWPVPRYAAKDASVRGDLVARFEQLVSAVLAGEEFAERV